MAVIMKGSSRNQVSIHNTSIIYKGSTADFKIETAFWHRSHATSPHTISKGWNFNTVADAGNRFVFREKMPGDPNQILIVANVLGSASSGKEYAKVLFLANLAEGNIGIDGIPLPLPGNGPARCDLVQNHLVAALFRRGYDRTKPGFNEPIIGVECVDGLSRVANYYEYGWFI